MSDSLLVFDIETVPDVEAGRRALALSADLPDLEVVSAMQEVAQSDFMPHPWHKIVSIGMVFETKGVLKIQAMGDHEYSEAVLVQRFFSVIEKYTPQLVSWNGASFDLPVLHYRALLHGVAAPRYWDTGDRDSSARWNNYLSRYHQRHIDLMDVLASYQNRAWSSLERIASLLGLPSKQGLHGSEVWQAYRAGEIDRICHYCLGDVVLTYLIFLRFSLIRGALTPEAYAAAATKLRQLLISTPGWEAFLEAWPPIDFTCIEKYDYV